MNVYHRRHKRRNALSPFVLFLILVVLATAGILAYFRFIRFPLKVLAKTQTIELGSNIPAAASDYLDGKAAELAKVDVDISDVDSAKTGDYQVELEYEGRRRTVTLIIADTVAPQVTLRRQPVITVLGKALAVDSLVEDIKDASDVTTSFAPDKPETTYQPSELGSFDVSVYVIDASGNQTVVPVQVKVVEADQNPPQFAGVDAALLDVGQSFDPLDGVTAVDEIDGDLTPDVQLEGEVDTSRTGAFTLTYSVADSSGNEARMVRTVTVSDPFAHLRGANVITTTGSGAASKPLHAVLEYLDLDVRFMGIVYQDLTTGDGFVINPDNQYRSASTAKVFVNMALYDAIDRGVYSLDQKIQYESSDFESGTGILQGMDLKIPYALSTLADYAVIYSDNIAFNMIRRFVGRQETFDYYESIIGHPTNRTNTSMGAADAAALMNELYTSDSANFQHMLDVMRQTQFNDMLPRFLPQGIVAHKVGFYNTVYHDIGIVFDGDKPYILTVFSEGLTYPSDKIATVSKLVYENR
ncbi:MAG: serine hydrolase [Eubacteriales bacterium]|nr:serine hydrolase [Eubacteriales bacterium]